MSKALSLAKRLKNVVPVRLVVISFFLIIVVGTLLLMLPICSRAGQATAMVDALFTATSATCVTGLVLFDTWTHWNTLGQIVILTLIQVGGLGLVTFTTGFALLTRGKLGLRDLWLASENTAGNTTDIVHLVKIILGFTFSCELAGAALLSIRFIPMFGTYGIWVAVFTAVSAYCNAGFDIMGFFAKDSSLTNFVEDPLVCLTVAFLIILGGLGFIVVSDIYFAQIEPRLKKKHSTRINLHSVIVLRMTAALLVIGTVFFLIAENTNTLKGLTLGGKLNAAFFQSTSLRTAGFASIPIGSEHDITKLMSVVLMFIGASPASTGGGIKTTTFLILLATVTSVLRGREDTVLRRRRIDSSIIYRALTIVAVALLIVFCTTAVILSTNTQSISAIDALFEATSGFGTVGLSAGITPILSNPSKVSLVLTMFIGRVGPVSLGLAIAMRHSHHHGVVLPEGKVIVG